jgi:hypothetical protein
MAMYHYAIPFKFSNIQGLGNMCDHPYARAEGKQIQQYDSKSYDMLMIMICYMMC